MRTTQQIHAAAQRYFVRDRIDEQARADAQECRRVIHNDGRLLKSTQCRVLKVFCVGGQPLTVGSTVTLQAHDAMSLQALGKVALL